MNNTAGASMGPYRGLKGSQRSKNGYNLDFTDFLNTFATIWVSGLAIVSSIQIIEQLEKNDSGAPTGLFRGPKGPKEAEMAIIFIFPFSWIHLRQIEFVAWKWSHIKDKLMQIIKQSINNAAGAPQAHVGASKGPKETKMAIILIFLIFWIHLQQFESVAWQWSHMKDKLMQINEQFEKNDAGAPMGPFRGPKGTQRSRNGYNFYFPDFLNKFGTKWVGRLAVVSYKR